MAGTVHKLEFNRNTPDFWSFSDEELATTCLRIAEGRISSSRPFFRAEAMRLYLVWRDAMSDPGQFRQGEGPKDCILDGLRKRTIQILIKLSLPAQAQPGR